MKTAPDHQRLKNRLKASPFRSSFHLDAKSKEYIRVKGLDTVFSHAGDLVRKRLGPALILNDGRQTPMKGHPVFIAQHATATCCRGCLEKWHGIKKGHELTQEEIDYIVDVIMDFIRDEIS